jgi:Rrf2 family nitric oxide-sensitive transcriptional repressor
MNKINRKLEYALIGLKHMRAKAPGELTSVKELTTAYGCPFDVTSRVMQVLAQKGVLISEQGAHGGYMLGRDLTKLSFQELSEILLGKVAIARCLTEASDESGHACEMRGSCNIVTPVQVLNRKLNDFYRSLSVADLLETRSSKAKTKSPEKSTEVEA